MTVKTIKKIPARTSGNFGDLNLYCRRHRAYRSMLRMNPELTLRSEWRLIQIRQLVSMIVEIGGYKSCSKCLRYVICGNSGESEVLGFTKKSWLQSNVRTCSSRFLIVYLRDNWLRHFGLHCHSWLGSDAFITPLNKLKIKTIFMPHMHYMQCSRYRYYDFEWT